MCPLLRRRFLFQFLSPSVLSQRACKPARRVLSDTPASSSPCAHDTDTPATLRRPIFLLRIKAELEGVAKFSVPADHVFQLDVKESAGSEERKDVQVDPDEEQEVPNSKNATAQLVMKFGGKQHHTLKVVTTELKGDTIRAQTSDDTGMVPIAAFECRGMEPTRWTPTTGYVAESEAGVVYDDVNFKDGDDWCEYDEKSDQAMTVGATIAHDFVLHKEKK